jgi:hypothetical protein
MLPFRSPFTAVVSGPTQCGKSALVLRITDNADSMIVPPPQRILYCYGEYQASFDAFRERVEFVEGLPSPERFDGRLHTPLVLDDLMAEADESVANIFTKISHHRNVSVFFLTQNLFHKNKHMRTMSLNAHYLILFKNPRDVSQFATLTIHVFHQLAICLRRFQRRHLRGAFLLTRGSQNRNIKRLSSANQHISGRTDVRLRQ